jgi:hypothetical protein
MYVPTYIYGFLRGAWRRWRWRWRWDVGMGMDEMEVATSKLSTYLYVHRRVQQVCTHLGNYLVRCTTVLLLSRSLVG